MRKRQEQRYAMEGGNCHCCLGLLQPSIDGFSRQSLPVGLSYKKSIKTLRIVLFLLAHLLIFCVNPNAAQQAYNDPYGYTCSDAQVSTANESSCNTFVLFTVQNQSSLSEVGDLFSVNSLAIASATNLSLSQKLSPGESLLLPISCTCVENRSQFETTYSIRDGDSLSTIANTIFGGLVTYQAIEFNNPSLEAQSIPIGFNVSIPIRCACPSREQQNLGVHLLLTYPVSTGDYVNLVAKNFGIDSKSILKENSLPDNGGVVLAQTTLLIPLRVKPNLPKSPSAPGGNTTIESPSSTSRKSLSVAAYVSIGLSVPALLLLAMVLLVCLVKKRRLRCKHQLGEFKKVPFAKPKLREVDLLSSMSGMFDTYRPVSFTLQQLKEATMDFNSALWIDGSVFRAKMKGMDVAVKQIKRDVSQEIKILCKIHHTNLVTLVGYCLMKKEQDSYLVYEYVENGSLSDWLRRLRAPRSFNRENVPKYSTLNWNTRLQIALDVAKGLEYIHERTNPAFVHKDIKSSNILLDQKFRAKIANFGMAKLAVELSAGGVFTRNIAGTQGYMAPEYATHGLVTCKLDVFAFGVVLMELLSGKEAVQKDADGKVKCLWQSMGPILSGPNAKLKLKNWIDPTLGDNYPFDCLFNFATIAKSCVDEDPAYRPDMKDVAFTLAKMLKTCTEWEPSGVLEESYADLQIQGR